MNRQKKMVNKSVGRNIQALRLKNDWKQEDVSSRLGVSVLTFSRIEAGAIDINLSRLQEIANIYEVSAASLLTMDVRGMGYALPATAEDLDGAVTQAGEIIELQRKLIMLYQQLHKTAAFEK